MFQCVLGVRIVNRMEFKDQEDAARLSSTSTNSVGHNGAGFLQRRHNREGEAGNRLPEETIGRASPQQRQFYETPLKFCDLLLTGDGQRHQGLATGNLTNAHIRLRLIGDTETSEGVTKCHLGSAPAPDPPKTSGGDDGWMDGAKNILCFDSIMDYETQM